MVAKKTEVNQYFGVDAGTYQTHMKLGSVALQGRNYVSAASHFDDAIKVDPTDGHAWIEKGAALKRIMVVKQELREETTTKWDQKKQKNVQVKEIRVVNIETYPHAGEGQASIKHGVELLKESLSHGTKVNETIHEIDKTYREHFGWVEEASFLEWVLNGYPQASAGYAIAIPALENHDSWDHVVQVYRKAQQNGQEIAQMDVVHNAPARAQAHVAQMSREKKTLEGKTTNLWYAIYVIFALAIVLVLAGVIAPSMTALGVGLFFLIIVLPILLYASYSWKKHAASLDVGAERIRLAWTEASVALQTPSSPLPPPPPPPPPMNKESKTTTALGTALPPPPPVP